MEAPYNVASLAPEQALPGLWQPHLYTEFYSMQRAHCRGTGGPEGTGGPGEGSRLSGLISGLSLWTSSLTLPNLSFLTCKMELTEGSYGRIWVKRLQRVPGTW